MFRYVLPKKLPQNTLIPKRSFSNCCFDCDKKSDFRNEINSWTNLKLGGISGATYFVFYFSSKIAGLALDNINQNTRNFTKTIESMKIDIDRLEAKIQLLESKKP